MIKGTRNKRDELFGYEMTEEAKEVLSRVPFFVRKRVRKRVEEETSGYCGSTYIQLSDTGSWENASGP